MSVKRRRVSKKPVPVKLKDNNEEMETELSNINVAIYNRTPDKEDPPQRSTSAVAREEDYTIAEHQEGKVCPIVLLEKRKWDPTADYFDKNIIKWLKVKKYKSGNQNIF